MTTVSFDWNAAKAAGNAAKHGVTFDEAATVFLDSLTLSMSDPVSSYEERWVTIGEATSGRLVLVVHTWSERDDGSVSVKIVSARRPTRGEARQYREGS